MKTLTACIALVASISGSQLAAAQSASMPVNLGINIGGVNDYAVESFFVDAMKQARHWGSVASPWDQAAATDAAGWPTQDAGVLVLCCTEDASGHSLIAGTYALSFQGQAQVATEIYPGQVSAVQYDAASNTSTATVTLADSGVGTTLYLAFTGTRRTPSSKLGSGITGVVLRRPQVAPNGQSWWVSPAQVFTTPFLALIQPYSTLRFMDFTATNGTAAVTWKQRTSPAAASQQAPNGAAWEYAIAMANAAHRDIWINVPDQANDAYVRSLAVLMHATLDPSLHVYVEYSNEVWNWMFGQATRNYNAAVAAVQADPGSPLAWQCPDYDTCRYQWASRRIALRIVQISRIFRGVYGADMPRVRPVYALQLGSSYTVWDSFGMLAATTGAPSRDIYAIAQAPYYTGDNSLDGQSQAQLIADATASLAPLDQNEHDFAALAAWFHLASITYEGGPGMSGQPSLANKIAANRSDAMGTLIQTSLQHAFGNGISLYMYYSDAGQFGQYGMWGTTENVFDLATPKVHGIATIMAAGVEPITTGAALPAAIAGADADLRTGGSFIAPDRSYLYLGTGGAAGYLLNVPATATYSISLNLNNAGARTVAGIAVDNVPAGRVAVPPTIGTWAATAPVAIPLAAGLHVLSVAAGQGPFALNQVSVATH